MISKRVIPERLAVTTLVLGIGVCARAPGSPRDATSDSVAEGSAEDDASDDFRGFDQGVTVDAADVVDASNQSPLCSALT